MRRSFGPACLLLLALAGVSSRAGEPQFSGDDSQSVMRVFASPPRQFSTGPLWTWNDMLTEEDVRRTLRDLAGQQVKQAWVFPTAGLMTPYLGKEWFALWRAALDEAEKLDMNIWIYDENSYPSGFAGGWVAELMPEARGRGLKFVALAKPAAGENVVAVWRREGERTEDVTARVRAGETFPAGKYVAAVVVRSPNSPWFADRCNTDRIYPGVTQKFLEVTLEAYRKEVGAQFGKRIPGVFTDEPNLAPAGGLPWTQDLPQVFARRWGYSLTENLLSLVNPIGDWRRVRHNYYQTLLDLFIQRWAKPYFEYCEKHGLELTGHYFEHTWPAALHGPDAMALAAWQHRPGIDILMNQYAEGPNAQFGNTRSVKEIGSLANQFGRRTLSETFACSGWEIRMEDIKRQAEWQYALGLNTLVECVGNISIRGMRKQCWPMALSYHESWFEAYHALARRFTRLAAALTGGREENPALLIEPTTSAWMIQSTPELKTLGDGFQKLVVDLAQAQAEFDLGCEDVLARVGAVEGDALRVGRARYRTVALPAQVENLNGPTVALLERVLDGGGTVLALGLPPTRVDGREDGRAAALAKKAGWRKTDPAKLADILQERAGDRFAIQRAPGDGGILYHMRRRLSDGELVFLVNTSDAAPAAGTVVSTMRGVEQWSLDTGKAGPYPFRSTAAGVEADFRLPPVGSVLLFLTKEQREPAAVKQAERWAPVAPAGPLETRRMGPNVLVVDYLNLTCGGKELKNAYYYAAGNLAFTQHGLKGNPWNHSVQFQDERIRTKFAENSGFEATYRFRIEGQAPRELWAVVERPELYTIACNGKPLRAEPGKWWLDRSFGRINVAGAARSGENRLALRAQPFTMAHEIEAIYILGDFRLKADDAGYAIVRDAPLELGPWKAQGCPFYPHGVAYRQRYQLGKLERRYVVELPEWHGSVAKVRVNGALCGHVIARPWEVEVTESLRPGPNEVEVEVLGTIKNAIGPFHAGPTNGKVWPPQFQTAPKQGPPAGEKYDTIGYGLFQAPVLKAARSGQ